MHPKHQHLISSFQLLMRHRKLDRAILDQNEPLDLEDQDLVISQLTAENNENLIFYKKCLAASILVELPPLLLLARAVAPTLLKSVLSFLIVLLNCLLLLNTIFDVETVSKVVYTHTQVNVAKVLNFNGVSVLNGVLVAQLLYVAFLKEKLGWTAVFAVVPVGNLVTLVLLRNWHSAVALDLNNLHGLKYKFKSV